MSETEKLETRIVFLEKQLDDWIKLCHNQNRTIETMAAQLQEVVEMTRAMSYFVQAAKTGGVPCA
jgi:uncharacterized coiled-coil protein SlyX